MMLALLAYLLLGADWCWWPHCLAGWLIGALKRVFAVFLLLVAAGMAWSASR